MADRPAPGATADTVSAELIENRGFTVSRRGFDQDEVKEFLQVVAGAVRSLHERIDRLQLDVADAEYQISNPKLDEDTLMRLVGDETGSILRSARATAAEMSANADRRAQEMREAVERECAQLRELVEREVAELRARAAHEIETQRSTTAAEIAEQRERAERETAELRARAEAETTALRQAAQTETTDLRSRAQAEAARVVDEARQSAGELREQAESAHARATEEAEAAAARIRNTATETAEQVVRRARAEAEALRQQAEHDRKLTVEGAQALREKILVDLTRRRRVASTQVEQLRAGRERLLQSYGLVRRTLEEINDELHRADEEARQAAAEAGQAYEAGMGDEPVAPDLLQAVPLPASLAPEEVGKEEVGKEEGAAEASPIEPGEAASGEGPGDGGPPTELMAAAPTGESTVVIAGAATEVKAAPPAVVWTGAAREAAREEPAAVSPPPLPPAAAKAAEPAGEEETLEKADTAEEAPKDAAVEAQGATAPETLEAAAPAADVPAAVEADPAESKAEATAPPALETNEETKVEAAEAAPSGRGRRRRGSGSGGGVDDLFARLRAGREEAVSQARTVLEAPEAEATAPAAVGESTPAEAEPVIESADTPAEEAAAAGADPATAEEQPAADKAEGPKRRTDLDLEPARSDEEEGWLQRRDQALGRVEMALTRRLKRAMQDEQNDLLDRLRSLRARPTPETLLPPLVEQQDRFSRSAAGLVDQAAQAGVAFALSVLSELGQQTSPPGTPPPVDEVDEELAAAIVTPLRHRLEETISENGEDDQAVLVEALGGAYREWKTQRLEGIAGDALADAFARGVVHATPPSVSLQWVVDDIDGPCSDCDDNVLAGALPRDEAFPTGQFHPPAHAGCRCIVVPSA